MHNDLQYRINEFEGPLDLLLHLITKNKIDINDIPISHLVDQYIEQINIYKELDMDIASEFLEMAARLIYMKTVSLLPVQDEIDEMRAELTGELIEYRICKEMAQKLSENTKGFQTVVREPVKVDIDKAYKRTHEPQLLVRYYLLAVGRGLRKLPPPKDAFKSIVAKKIVSVSAKIVFVLRNLRDGRKKSFHSLFKVQKSRSDVVATFMAVLELMKAKRLTASEKNGEILLKMNKAG